MKRILAPALLALSAALAAAPSTALAWGATGHRMVARLAAQQLTPQARARIDALLAGEPDPTLAGIANWADELRGKDPGLGKATARWHYVNLADHDCVNAQCSPGRRRHFRRGGRLLRHARYVNWVEFAAVAQVCADNLANIFRRRAWARPFKWHHANRASGVDPLGDFNANFRMQHGCPQNNKT